jgi:hypothetical protein
MKINRLHRAGRSSGLLQFFVNRFFYPEVFFPGQGNFFAVIHDDIGDLVGPEQVQGFQIYGIFFLPGPVQFPGIGVDQNPDKIADKEFFNFLQFGIEFFVAVYLGLLKFCQVKVPGPENHVMSVVKTPVAELNPVLADHFIEKFGTRQRGQYQKLNRGKVGMAGKPDCFFDRIPVVFIKSQYEHAVNVDMMLLEYPNGPADILNLLVLLHGFEAERIDGFESDIEGMAPRFFHQPDQFPISGNVGPDLGGPAEMEVFPEHGIQQIPGMLRIGREIIIIKKDVLAPGPVLFQFINNMLDRAEPESFAENRRYRTKGTVERAAPGGLYGNGFVFADDGGLPAE